MRPDKSSATGNENASRSSSWFRFDDGISVLVHFFVSFVVHLMRVFFCVVSEFFAILVLRKKNEKEKREKREKTISLFPFAVGRITCKFNNLSVCTRFCASLF